MVKNIQSSSTHWSARLAGLQPADMRKAQRNLNRLQDMYHPGKVELGEQRMIEDQID